MYLHTVCSVEVMLKKLLERRVRARECRETVANITGRQDAEILAQPARTPAVIGDRDDRRDGVVCAANCSILRLRAEAFEYRRESGAAADRDDSRRWNRDSSSPAKLPSLRNVSESAGCCSTRARSRFPTFFARS